MNIPDVIGRFHPVLVHLPIGILLLAGLFQLLALKPKYASLHGAMSIALFWGMISAVVSCISGYFLSQSGDYDEGLVSTHQWFGISTAFLSLIAYLFNRWENIYAKWVILLMVPALIITGHLGGSLTHGSDFLTKGLDKVVEEKEGKQITDVQEANAYTDIVQPIFENKCYTCHNKSKKKGGLRLDEPELILKGGKDGEVVNPGDAEGSEMIKRILLPHTDDDHMPPKEKPQLKENEIALLHWWIATGASFDKKVKEIEQPEKIKPVLLALQNKQIKTKIQDIPAAPVAAADEKILKQLHDRGVAIIPVTRNSNYLSANFVAVDSMTGTDLSLLISIKKQLTWLKLSGKHISDSMVTLVAQLTKLTRLQLDNTSITDKGLASLRLLNELQYLNLVGTGVTAKGVLQLKDLPHLQSVYLYKTFISSAEWQLLKNNFPKVTLDTGGYVVPTLESDTTELKEAVKKNL